MVFLSRLGSLEKGTTEAAVRSLANYVRALQEELEYRLANLDSSNITEIDTDLTTLRGGIADAVTELAVTVNGVTVTDRNGATRIRGDSIETDTLRVRAANIDGTLRAEQIETDTLRVQAANIDGTLQAEQIETESLRVRAANIDGRLTADQITLSGAITWADLDSGVQSSISSAGGISTAEARTLITGTLVSSPTLRGAEIYGGTYYGNEFNVHPDTAGDNSFNLYGISGTDEFNFLKITCRPNSDTVEIWSPGGADIHFGGDRTVFGGDYTVFEGKVDFTGAAVTGLNVSASAVWG